MEPSRYGARWRLKFPNNFNIKVVAPGERPPAGPEELRKSFFTGRKKDVIEFDYEDSGKTAYLAAQVENGRKKGPWGPMVSAVIP